MVDKKVMLSTAWLFAILNYLYCDIVGLMDSSLLAQFLTGTVGGIEMTRGFLLGASILMEIPIAMVLLSRTLEYRANRLSNIVAGLVMTVVQASSIVFGASPAGYYVFFSAVEISCTLFVVWYAWRWVAPQDERQST